MIRLPQLARWLPVASFLLLSPAQAYEERSFSCLTAAFQSADTDRPASLEEAFLAGPWAPPCSKPSPAVPAFGSFTNTQAQAWFGEGLTRVHLFDLRGAEAAFRMALKLDPSAPAAYWGLALANPHRPGRSALFLQEARKRLSNRSDLAPGERRLIAEWNPTDPVPLLIALSLKHPDSVTLEALLLHSIILADLNGSQPVANPIANERQILALPEGHPARVLHLLLWRNQHPERSLNTARELVAALPDRSTVWQFAADAFAATGEESLAIQHAAEGLLRQAFPPEAAPLIRLLTQAGRFREATTLCDQLIALPADLAPGMPSPPSEGLRLYAELSLLSGQEAELLKRCREPMVAQLWEGSRAAMTAGWCEGLALLLLDRPDDARAMLGRMKQQLQKTGSTDPALLAPPTALRELLAGRLPSSTSGLLSPLAATLLAERLGFDTIPELPKGSSFLAQAGVCNRLWAAGNEREAQRAFTRSFQDQAKRADADLPILAQLDPLAASMQLPKTWRRPVPAPVVDLVIAFPKAPVVQLHKTDGSEVPFPAPARPTMVNFFVGVACPVCLRQLVETSPLIPRFEADGIDFLSITPNRPKTLRDANLPFKILADADEDAFRGFGAHDWFGDRPLHAMVLLSPKGEILWRQVSEAPFRNPAALHQEALRLLGR